MVGSVSRPLDAALDYARRGWPVSPWRQRGNKKWPLTDHGYLDATVDEAVIRDWWRQHPDAVPSVATGERSGIVAFDIDIRPNGSGFDTLEIELGVSTHPVGPTAHSPRGGCAVLFQWPGHYVKSTTSELGAHLDIKADGGSLLLPPGPRRWWDPHLGPDTPIGPMPDWMHLPAEAGPPQPETSPAPPPIRPQQLIRYGEVALDNAIKAIAGAPAGQQHDTLNREVYSIGRLVAGAVIPSGLAMESLLWAARQMPSHDTRRPWNSREIDRLVRRSFADGLANPRVPESRP